MNAERKRPEADAIRAELRSLADPARAVISSRFFKTGPGDYGERDRFLGVSTPAIRKLAKARIHAASKEVQALLRSEYHEERLAALLILVEQYRRGDASRRKAVRNLYLGSTSYINSWDLVDVTAPHIVGGYAFEEHSPVPTELALSPNLWERRIAIVATHYFIRRGDSSETFRIAGLLLRDSEDLIHKAVGWMLREAGKHCSLKTECRFLDAHAARMPRTMLRYAVERFPDRLRLKYLNRK